MKNTKMIPATIATPNPSIMPRKTPERNNISVNISTLGITRNGALAAMAKAEKTPILAISESANLRWFFSGILLGVVDNRNFTGGCVVPGLEKNDINSGGDIIPRATLTIPLNYVFAGIIR